MEKKKEKSEYGNWKVVIKQDKFRFVETYFRASNPNGVIEMTRIRKLTPIECERLQTLPDNYTE